MLERIPHYEYVAGREERLLLVGWLLLSHGPQALSTGNEVMHQARPHRGGEAR